MEKEKGNNMFAVIKSGGRQYKVSAGQRLEVNRLPVEVGKQVQFDEVLLISDADTTMVGSPLLENALVLATATEHARGKKLIVFKYKSKKRYRHRRGHRQELTVFTIDDIVADGKSLITGEAPTYQQDKQAIEALELEEAGDEILAAESAGEAEESGSQAADAEADAEHRSSRRRRVRKAEDADDEGDK